MNIDNQEITELEKQVTYVLKKLNNVYEVLRLKGFSTQRNDGHISYMQDDSSVDIHSNKRLQWINDLDIDNHRLRDILDILANRGLITKYRFLEVYQ